jgi:hypothetical protein
MSKKIKSLKILELEDKLYDLAFALRLSRSKSEQFNDVLEGKIVKTKFELENLGWKAGDNFENEFEQDLRPEDFIGMI